MFSLREPTQPQKVMMNMRIPTTISITAGSTDRHARAASDRREGKRSSKTDVSRGTAPPDRIVPR